MATIITSLNDPLYLTFREEFISLDPEKPHFEKLGGRTWKKYGRKQQDGLLKMFWSSFGGFRPHIDNDGLHGHIDAFGTKQLRKLLANDVDLVRGITCKYYQTGRHNLNRYKSKKTKKWMLWNETEDVLIKIFSSDIPLEVNFDDLFKTKTHKPETSNIEVPTYITIDPKVLDGIIEEFETALTKYTKNNVKWLEKYGYPDDIRIKRNRLLMLRKTSLSLIPKFSIPNLYHRGESNRLFGTNINLQFTSKEVRHTLLSGRNLYDYDFQLCHPTIICSLLKHINHPTDKIEHYLNHRLDVVKEFVELLRLNEGDVKELFTIIVYSDQIKSPKKAIFKLCRRDKERISKLVAHKFFNELIQQYKSGRKALLVKYQTEDKILSPTGHFSNRIKGEEDEDKERTIGSKIAFILQSIESELLEIACSPFDDTVLLCFDGWISPKRDKVKVEETVNKNIKLKTGIDFNIKLKETPVIASGNLVDK